MTLLPLDTYIEESPDRANPTNFNARVQYALSYMKKNFNILATNISAFNSLISAYNANGTPTSGFTTKSTLDDADQFAIANSADSNNAYKVLWSTLKSYLVQLTGDQTISGVKTFSSSGIKVKSTDNTHFATITNSGTSDVSIAMPIASGTIVGTNTTAYSNDTASFITNTLASGAIIERGSVGIGKYIKFADGLLICTNTFQPTPNIAISNAYGSTSGTSYRVGVGITYPIAFVGENPSLAFSASATLANVEVNGPTLTGCTTYIYSATTGVTHTVTYIAIGRWK